MIVKKLIAKLSKLDPKAKVVLPSDAEGNSFNTWDGSVTTEPNFDGTEFQDEGGSTVVVIWPN